jgi:hypothetical protein
VNKRTASGSLRVKLSTAIVCQALPLPQLARRKLQLEGLLRARHIADRLAAHPKNIEASIGWFSRRGPSTSFTSATLCLSFPRVLFALLHPRHEHIQPSTGHGQSEAWSVHQRDQVSSLSTARLLFTFLQMLSASGVQHGSLILPPVPVTPLPQQRDELHHFTPVFRREFGCRQ